MSGDAVIAARATQDLPPLTISLTSIRSRIGHVDRVIRSLLAQSPAPDHVMLVLSQEPYLLDEGVPPEALPPGLRQLWAEGRFELVYAENTGPYRKLLPALRRHAGEERLIVTADDDMVYPEGWLACLVETYRRHRCVVGHRCRAIPVQGGRFLPYADWELLTAGPDIFGEVPEGQRGLFTIATGFRGILYNTRFFPDLGLIEELRALAPRQDDLAFKAAALAAGIPTVPVDRDLQRGPFAPRLTPADGSDEALIHGNLRENDAAWGRLIAHLEARGLFRLAGVVAPPRKPLSPREVQQAIPADHARQVDAEYYLARIPPAAAPLQFLDLGAGDGSSFDLVRARHPDAEWVGLDIADSDEVRARTRTDCRFVTYDGVTIPFEDGRFDVVYSRQVFEHVRHPEALMREIHRVLKPGGRFIGSVSQLEPFHSNSYWNFTWFGFATIATEAGLALVEMRPGMDGVTLTLRNLLLRGLRTRSRSFRRYFDRDSPLNLLIGHLLAKEGLDAADAAELERLRGFLSDRFPAAELMRDYVPRAGVGVREVNAMKLQYAGHICFEFQRPGAARA
ncbi:methyltransferase domain-containing protein [Sediminicoccus sp. BL-A-41-H5]|uniref:methyltransferase domain-containing protein n=1 Tax=Sediminicoccus sp. BL-A-41-H5 TaxID=3421106 RepID=UPI003D6734F0